MQRFLIGSVAGLGLLLAALPDFAHYDHHHHRGYWHGHHHHHGYGWYHHGHRGHYGYTGTIDVSQPAWPAPQEAGGLGR